MNFCSKCSAKVSLQIPTGDNLPRFVCENCGEIHYQNPKVVVGALATWEDRVLLCKRAIEPRHGLWTLPAGFMENAETIGQAALRETQEEANARIELIDVYTLVNVPHISQVHIFYCAKLLDTDFAAGIESLEVGLFRENEIPWQDVAFRSVTLTLKYFFDDRRADQFKFRVIDLSYPGQT